MTISPREAIHNAVSNIEDLLRVIRRQVSNQEAITTEFTTESRAQAFMGLENNLDAALLAFRTEIDGAGQTMTDASQPKPADKVWVMYDRGPPIEHVKSGRWYMADDIGFSTVITCEDGIDRAFIATSWHRHVGPTPPNESPAPAESINHDGSAKRPKGVGKRDIVKPKYYIDVGFEPLSVTAGELSWCNISSYRIIERAPKKEKRIKVWVVDTGASFLTHEIEKEAIDMCDEIGGTLYTAKLKEVTE